MDIFKLNSHNIKTCIYLQKYIADLNQILYNDKNQLLFCEWSKAGVEEIQDGGRPPFWKNRKTAIISSTVLPIGTKFDTVTQLTLQQLTLRTFKN